MDIGFVIFDCDGVLFETEPITNKVIADNLVQYGIAMTAEKSRLHFGGLTDSDTIFMVQQMATRRIPANFMGSVCRRELEMFEREPKSIPGALAAIEPLAVRRIPTCVASNGSLKKMGVTLGATGLLPLLQGRVYSRDDVELGKPTPDIFLHAAKSMGVVPGRCVVIEDSAPGSLPPWLQPCLPSNSGTIWVSDQM